MQHSTPTWGRTRRGWAGLFLACLALCGCSDQGAGPGSARGSTAPAGTGSASPTPTDTSLPPAAQDRQPCPTQADRPLHRRGLGVTGYVRGSGRRVAILSHQSRGTPCDLAALGAALDEAGFRVLAWTAGGSTTVPALRALVRQERARGARSVVLVGASLGAATSVVAAGGIRPAVDAVVSLSASDQSDVNGDVARAAARYTGPLLAVAGEYDPSFAELPAELASVHDGPESVAVVPGSGDHGKEFVERSTSPMTACVVGFVGGVVAGDQTVVEDTDACLADLTG